MFCCFKTKLSPERPAQKEDEVADQHDKEFLKGSNVYRPRGAKPLNWSQDSLSFDESWPDSEQPSSLK